jgi:hypothetical protein
MTIVRLAKFHILEKHKNGEKIMQKNVHKALILFLDFDGVVHTEPCAREEDFFTKLPLIAEVLKEYEVEVVISSSWRTFYTLNEIKDQFLPEIAHLIVGATPDLKRPNSNWTPPTSRAERQAEIEKWLKDNREWGQPWLAIDDCSSWFEPGCKNLICTDRSTGFTPENALQLHAMIKEYLS